MSVVMRSHLQEAHRRGTNTLATHTRESDRGVVHCGERNAQETGTSQRDRGTHMTAQRGGTHMLVAHTCGETVTPINETRREERSKGAVQERGEARGRGEREPREVHVGDKVTRVSSTAERV